ncbi:putative DNA-binding transcriptional regulator YafY [Rahnella sp. BIGb0236]|uniref:helix-turn-helix transcriptional regulator n=1 Tax=Rahnella sp. BIGb0236 TaxID=2485117 RepID=UPI0010D888AE|nr:WYL domain-containing protein [Rahnella sp. BIGb0236]TDS88032.1 putative DNA-binding transcriptional regulator YafY [Rahnella sp. BIGb0236]
MMHIADKRDNTRHELLIDRIFGIFEHIYQGKTINKDWLCKAYNITSRTAYRDLARLGHLLEETSSAGNFVLNKHLQPNFSNSALNQFAQWVDVAKLFSDADGKTLRNELAYKDAVIITGNTTQDNRLIKSVMRDLKEGITRHRSISFTYSGKARQANPYKLINQSGIWYLVAEESGKLKSFNVSKIQYLFLMQVVFIPDPTLEKEITEGKGIWFGEKTSVTLIASKKAAVYLRRRQLFPDQNIISEHTDGSITLTAKTTDAQLLFRWLRYWLPEISIAAPLRWQDDFNRELQASVAQMQRDIANIS